MKILGIILLVVLIAGIVYYISQLKDRDGDGDLDLADAKLTAEDIEKDLKAGVEEVKETVKTVKRRAKRVKEELKDVVDAVEDTVDQIKDVAGAAKGKPRKGRKPAAKKTSQTKPTAKRGRKAKK